MNSILNDVNKEIKEETEEEKIDIENHFLPAISRCEQNQLTRSVRYIMNKASFLVNLANFYAIRQQLGNIVFKLISVKIIAGQTLVLRFSHQTYIWRVFCLSAHGLMHV